MARVACGSDHSAVLAADGALWVWGRGQSGQLGLGRAAAAAAAAPRGRQAARRGTQPAGCAAEESELQDQLHPVRVRGAIAGLRVAAVAAGANHTVALASTGAVFTFGEGACGQLGHGSMEDCATPRHVEAVRTRVTVIAAVAFNTILLTAESAVLLCGADGGLSPVRVAFDDSLRQRESEGDESGEVVSRLCGGCQANHMAVITSQGRVFMWYGGHLFAVSIIGCGLQPFPSLQADMTSSFRQGSG